MSSVVDLARGLRAALGAFEPGLLSGFDAAATAEELAAVAKACSAGAARAAARAAECGAHRHRGYADPADWLARATGSSHSQARDALGTAAGIDDCPATKDALLHGELSLEQAKHIVHTEAAVPGSEADLLETAKHHTLQHLGEAARRRRHDAADKTDLHRRQRAARRLRSWTDALGMTCFAGALPPEDGVLLITRLHAEAARRRRLAKSRAKTDPDSGPLESWDAYTADALMALLLGANDAATDGSAHAAEPLPGNASAVGGAASRRRQADLVIVCDLRAWRRGTTHGGEVCHIVGGGPIPVDLAHQLSEDAFLKAVIHDGVAINTVAHFGRHIPAHLRTALDLGQPPTFEGVVCCEDNCDDRLGLEWDHINPVANRGPTQMANLTPRCWEHHQAKTARDREAGLLDGRDTPGNDDEATDEPP